MRKPFPRNGFPSNGFTFRSPKIRLKNLHSFAHVICHLWRQRVETFPVHQRRPSWQPPGNGRARMLVTQSCPTLCGHLDCSPPVHGTFQAKILEWVAISYSRVVPSNSIKHCYCEDMLQLWLISTISIIKLYLMLWVGFSPIHWKALRTKLRESLPLSPMGPVFLVEAWLIQKV